MFEIVITACLTGAMADVCADRMISAPLPMTRSECQSYAKGRQQGWAEDHPGHTVKSLDCVPLAEAGAPLPVTEIAPGLFVHEGLIDMPSPENEGDLANVGFVVGSEAVAVIDAGGSRPVGEALYRAVRAATDKPIRWVILTHMHPDHTLGAELFAEAGATIIGHEKLDRGLRARAANYEASIDDLIGPKAFIGTRVAFPTAKVEDVKEIDLGGRVLELRAWPTAHTDNDITVLDGESATLFTGDLVFDTHTPALDGSLTGWIDLLGQIDGVKQIVPGHGKAPLPWPEGGAATRRYLDVLAADTRKAIRKGENINDAVAHIAESERHKWKLFDEFNPRNATAAFGELEWE